MPTILFPFPIPLPGLHSSCPTQTQIEIVFRTWTTFVSVSVSTVVAVLVVGVFVVASLLTLINMSWSWQWFLFGHCGRCCCEIIHFGQAAFPVVSFTLLLFLQLLLLLNRCLNYELKDVVVVIVFVACCAFQFQFQFWCCRASSSWTSNNCGASLMLPLLNLLKESDDVASRR